MTLRRDAASLINSTKANASAVGIANNATNLGTFAGSTIPDNRTVKQAIQAVETAVETKATAAALGVAAEAEDLGAFTSPLIDDNLPVKDALASAAANLESDDPSKGAALIGLPDEDGAKVADYLGETVRVIKYMPILKRLAIWANDYLQTDVTFDMTDAWDAARAYGDSLGVGVTYEFPRGKIKADIDATGTNDSFVKYMNIRGQGRGATIITPTGSGKPILNMAGRNRMTVSDLTFQASAYQAPCAIYMVRTAESPNCNNNKFDNVEIEGNFSAHAVVSCAAESSLWSNCRIAPLNSTGDPSGFWTGSDPALCGVTAPSGVTPAEGPNTDNRMVDCEFYSTGTVEAPKDGVTNITLSESAGWVFDNVAHINGQATNSVAFRIQADGDGVFNGPVFINNNHFEAFGAGNKGIYVDGTGALAVYNVHLNGGNAVVDNAYRIVDFNRDQDLSNGPLWVASSFIMPGIPATIGSGLPAYVWGMSACRVWWHDRFGAGDFVVFSFAARCHIDAAFPAIGANAQSSIIQWSDAAPTSGTYPRGQVVRASWSGTAVAVGQPTEFVAFDSGTMGGSPNGGATTASVTNGSRAITFSSATDLKVGQWLRIGGNDYRLAILDGASSKLATPYLGTTSGSAAVSFKPTGFSSNGSLNMTIASAVSDANANHTINATFSNTEVKAALDALGAKVNEMLLADRNAFQRRT